jgi:DNA-binding LacI/PurR family transcriptional regulator
VNGPVDRVRISDVAAAAGVSKALVSYALNDRPGVSEVTRQRIVETARSMGWTPSVRARALSQSRAFAVGIVLRARAQDLAADQYYLSLLAGMTHALAPTPYSLIVEVVPDAASEAAAYRRWIAAGRVDGVVLTDLRSDDPRPALLRESGIARITLGEVVDPDGMPVLAHEERPAIESVAGHLAGLGHRRVAVVAGPGENDPASRRRAAYQEAFAARGIECRSVVGEYTAESGRELTTHLLDSGDAATRAAPRATAFVYGNDLMAIGGMGALTAAGLRVPQDVSVIGWDDIAVARHLNPPLSTVAQHPYDDGQTAAEILLEAIEGRRFVDPVRTPDPRFVARGSSGAGCAR